MSGEDQLLEWKESWRDEYLRWICGFANAEGGTLIIGKDDRGNAVGAPGAERLLVELPNKIRDVLGIVVPVRLVREAGLELIEICGEPQPTPISYRGEYHVRSGSTKQQLTGAALSAFLLRRLGRHWDSAPVPGVNVEDLDPQAFKRFRKHARNSERIPSEALSAPNQELLERLHLTEAGMLKRAAVLLFHEEPERWFTGAYVKIGMFRSSTDIAYHDEVHGDLFTQIDQTIELLRTKYMFAWISYQGLQRMETYPIPRDALREAVLNALIHKDYSSGVPIQIRVFRDRLTLWNAGELPPTWTAARLLAPHPSRPPNPDLANAFFRCGLIEAWGRGFDKIREACREAGTAAPGVEHDGSGLTLEWTWTPPEGAEQLLVHDLVDLKLRDPFRGTVQDPRQASVQDSTQASVQDPTQASVLDSPLSTPQIARLLGAFAGGIERSAGELRDILGLQNRAHFQRVYLTPALAAGLIEHTLPDRPSSRRQGYRLVRSTPQVTVHDPVQVTAHDPLHVTVQVDALLEALSGGIERNAGELRDSLNLQNRANFQRAYLDPALAAGLIERTHPDNPRSPHQKYRLTAAGSKWVVSRKGRE